MPGEMKRTIHAENLARRIVKRIQLTADHGDIELSGASVYFKTARSASQSLPNVPSLNQKRARQQAGSILIAITTTNAAYQRHLQAIR